MGKMRARNLGIFEILEIYSSSKKVFKRKYIVAAAAIVMIIISKFSNLRSETAIKIMETKANPKTSLFTKNLFAETVLEQKSFLFPR